MRVQPPRSSSWAASSSTFPSSPPTSCGVRPRVHQHHTRPRVQMLLLLMPHACVRARTHAQTRAHARTCKQKSRHSTHSRHSRHDGANASAQQAQPACPQQAHLARPCTGMHAPSGTSGMTMLCSTFVFVAPVIGPHHTHTRTRTHARARAHMHAGTLDSEPCHMLS